MRQKIAYIFKYNLLAALLVAGVFCSAVGITWCRYQKTEKLSVDFEVYGPGNFVLLGNEDGVEPGVWYQEEATGNMRMDFRVANGSEENYPVEDSRFILRLLTTEGIPADATVTLTVEEEDGLRQVYTVQEETIVLEGKYLILGNEMGNGTRYRFVQENGEEAVFGLQGGKRSIARCSIVVSGETLPFLAELQLIDAAYGMESYMPTGYAPMEEVTATYILPEWKEGQTNPETQLILTAKDADFHITGILTCTTDSPYVVPTLRLTEEDEESHQENGETVTVPLEGEHQQQSIYIELVPDMEALSQIKEPVLAAVTVQWQISSDEEKVIEAELLVVLNPVKEKPAEVPDEEATPDGEGAPDVETVPDGEGVSEEETVPDGEGVSGEETTPEDEVTAREEDAPDSENPSSEGKASSEESGSNDKNHTDDVTEEAEVEATALSETQTTEAENSTDSIKPTESEAPESSTEFTDSTEPTESGTDSTEDSTESTEPIESETDSAEDSTESTEPIEPETDGTEDSAESTEPTEPESGSAEEATEPTEPEIEVYTFLVPTDQEAYQLAITGIQEQLSVYHILAEQQENGAVTGNALEQRLSELRITSNLASWKFELPASVFTWETTVEALTEQGFVAIDNRTKPDVAVSDVTEGRYLGGRQYAVTASQVLAGTYRLVLTVKTDDNIVLHTESIPFFVNYRFDTALDTEAVQEEQGE